MPPSRSWPARALGGCSSVPWRSRSTSSWADPDTSVALLADHGYRNGYGKPRRVAIGTWPLEVRPPRISDLPPEAPPFHSSILPRRRMLSAETQRLFARLYLEGLSSGDFEPAFRELLGEAAPLSSSTILRLKEEWASEYAAWRVRPLTARYAYCWADGIYLGAGLEPETLACWSSSAPARTVARSCWPWSSVTARALPAGPTCCAASRRAVWRRRCWPLATGRSGCGRRYPRCSGRLVISAAGTTGCSTS